jgi:hypothetical protein
MRVLYALIAFAMGSYIWPAVFDHGKWDMWHGVGVSMLAALSALAALGIRYPLQMLPVLLFEFVWKTIFVLSVALPLWRTGQLDPATRETAIECLIGVIVCPLVIPWGYFWANYVRRSGDRWRRRVANPVGVA